MTNEQKNAEDITLTGAKNTADVLIELLKVRWGQFSDRRTYEFKVTIAFWSALALGIAGACTADMKIEVSGYKLGVGVFIITTLHAYWCWGLWRAQNGDRLAARSYEDMIRELVGHEFDQKTLKEFKKWKPSEPKDEEGWFRTAWRCIKNPLPWVVRNWTHVFQVSVTAILSLCMAFLLWLRDINPPSPKESAELAQLLLANQKLDYEGRKLEAEIEALRKAPATSSKDSVHPPSSSPPK